jgi:hypothetical protein
MLAVGAGGLVVSTGAALGTHVCQAQPKLEEAAMTVRKRQHVAEGCFPFMGLSCFWSDRTPPV